MSEVKPNQFENDIRAPHTVEGRIMQLQRLFGLNGKNDLDLVCIDCNTVLDYSSATDEHEHYMISKCPECKRSWSITHDGDEVWMELIRHNVIYHRLSPREVHNPVRMVENFHHHIKAIVGEKPQLMPVDLAKKRLGYLQKEIEEYQEARENQDLEKVFDAQLDILYLLLGDVVADGLQDKLWEGFAEVHRSNMTKEPNGDGKAIKGIFYFPPDLKSILNDTRYPTQEEIYDNLPDSDKDEISAFRDYMGGKITGDEKLKYEGFSDEEIARIRKNHETQLGGSKQ